MYIYFQLQMTLECLLVYKLPPTTTASEAGTEAAAAAGGGWGLGVLFSPLHREFFAAEEWGGDYFTAGERGAQKCRGC